METCSCGETKKHTVSLRWSPKMTAPVPFIDEPVFAHLDYEQFGEVTWAPVVRLFALSSVLSIVTEPSGFGRA